VLARFVSADWIVPHADALTVNAFGKLAGAAFGQASQGPRNPQDLNRYVYVNGNPLKYNDPSGHCLGPTVVACAYLGAAAAKAAVDAAIVVAGGYLVYEGVNRMASHPMADATQQNGDGHTSVGGAGELAGATDGSADQTPAATPQAKGGTYVLKNPQTGEIERTGRTTNLDQRRKQHARDPALGDLQVDPDSRTDDYAEQRGREQILHDKYNPPRNKIKPIRPNNPRRDTYMDKGKKVQGRY
jgi:hypothetical protein